MEGIRALSVAPHRLRVEFLCLITLRHKRRASILLCNPMASAVAYKLRFPGLFSTSRDAGRITGCMEVEHKNQAWQHSEPSLVHWDGEVCDGWLSPWLCGPSLMLMQFLSTLSYLSLLYKWGSFLVSPGRDLAGHRLLLLLLLWERVFSLPMFLLKHFQGKRKDRAEEKSTRAGTGCSAWLCHSPVTNVPLGLREMAGTEGE